VCVCVCVSVSVGVSVVCVCVCVSVALAILHANRTFSALNYTVICGLSGSVIFFPHYLINGTNFGKRILDIKCVFIFFTTSSETVVIIRRIGPHIVVTAHISVFK